MFRFRDFRKLSHSVSVCVEQLDLVLELSRSTSISSSSESDRRTVSGIPVEFSAGSLVLLGRTEPGDLGGGTRNTELVSSVTTGVKHSMDGAGEGGGSGAFLGDAGVRHSTDGGGSLMDSSKGSYFGESAITLKEYWYGESILMGVARELSLINEILGGGGTDCSEQGYPSGCSLSPHSSPSICNHK